MKTRTGTRKEKKIANNEKIAENNEKKIKRALIIYPPVGKFLRGEDRCQSEVEASAATNERAPLDAMQMGGVLRSIGIKCMFHDYPMEEKTWEDFKKDVSDFKPDMLIVSTTNSTLFEDMEACRIAKSIDGKIITMMKGAIFYNLPLKLLDKRFKDLDIALRIEPDTILREVVENLEDLSKIKSVFYQKRGKWHDTGIGAFLDDLDSIPMPDRSIIKNEYYVRPDTGEMMTIIQTSRGCPFNCIYCLTPKMSGRKVRFRSAKNIVDEIEDCVKNYGIRNFFLRADTFTVNKKNVQEMCSLILEKGLDISWVANSRTDTIDEETIIAMKKAGCYLVAYGFEVGTNDAKKKIRKASTIEQDIKAMEISRKHGMLVYGFFMIGFPWETEKEIKETISFMRRLDPDFVEIHLATPFIGSDLYSISLADGLVSKEDDVIGHTYFSDPSVGTKHVSLEQLKKLRNDALRSYYLRPKYVLRTLKQIDSFAKFKNYAKYGLRLVKNTLG